MEFLVLLVMLIGGGLFAYRQWMAINNDSKGQPKLTPPVDGHSPVYTVEVLPARPEQTWQSSPSQTSVHPVAPSPAQKARMNKYLFASLCLVYIVCPIDLLPDFIPVLGWGDDIGALVIGLRALLRD